LIVFIDLPHPLNAPAQPGGKATRATSGRCSSAAEYLKILSRRRCTVAPMLTSAALFDIASVWEMRKRWCTPRIWPTSVL